MVDNVEPIHFSDDTQMDESNGKAQLISNNVVIITPAPLTKGAKKETIVHGGSSQQYSTMWRATTRLNLKPTWDVKTKSQNVMLPHPNYYLTRLKYT